MKGEVPEEEYTIPLGLADIKREGTDVTVVAWMGMLHRSLEAAEELEREGISVEVVDPRTLRPLDKGTILNSVRKTHRAVIVEAGAGFAGLGAEIGTIITEEVFDYLDSQVVRVTGANAPMPYARNLELAKTPTKAEIIAGIKKALAI
jgi:pyruvate dehydrogenase E1 component beta subunit